MGNFDNDEGQKFLSFKPRGQITNSHSHILYIPHYLIEGNFIEGTQYKISSCVCVLKDFNYKTAIMLI